MKQPKRHYAIIRNGRKVGENWAISPEKAVNNYWWTNDKCCNPYTKTWNTPSDYDAIEI